MFCHVRNFSTFIGCQMGTSRNRIIKWFGLVETFTDHLVPTPLP